MKKSLVLAGLLAACTAHSQVVIYDFDMFYPGINAAAPVGGQFDYQNGILTDAFINEGFGNESYAATVTDRNTVLTFNDGFGGTLSGTFTSPLLGQTDTMKGGFFGPPGSFQGYCGGSASCDAPIVFTATKVQQAPELNSGSAVTSMMPLVGGILVLRGKRSAGWRKA